MTKKAKRQKVEAPVVPEDGGEAYKAGFTAADVPFPEDSEEWDAWNEQFDAAADEATDAAEPGDTELVVSVAGLEPDEEEPAEKSVVKAEYRARYAEAGHPSHCGDELAILLNNLCLTKKGIEVERLDALAAANDVDLSKYNRTSRGWQGRLRMTARNILAGKVFANGGILKAGIEGTEPEYRLSAEWMASRRKTKEPAAA